MPTEVELVDEDADLVRAVDMQVAMEEQERTAGDWLGEALGGDGNVTRGGEGGGVTRGDGDGDGSGVGDRRGGDGGVTVREGRGAAVGAGEGGDDNDGIDYDDGLEFVDNNDQGDEEDDGDEDRPEVRGGWWCLNAHGHLCMCVCVCLHICACACVRVCHYPSLACTTPHLPPSLSVNEQQLTNHSPTI